MVEIDHGNGLSTRYGHLSEINVKVGDHIKIGQVIGAVGSTGRSTGPHLHYETRIDGDAVDPQKFLRAGVRLSAARLSGIRLLIEALIIRPAFFRFKNSWRRCRRPRMSVVLAADAEPSDCTPASTATGRPEPDLAMDDIVEQLPRLSVGSINCNRSIDESPAPALIRMPDDGTPRTILHRLRAR